MDINQLLQNLKHGYGYTAIAKDGAAYQVLVPPNKHMIRASEVIMVQSREIERMTHNAAQSSRLLAEAFADCERLTKELNDAKKTIQDQLGNSLDGNTKGDAEGSTD